MNRRLSKFTDCTKRYKYLNGIAPIQITNNIIGLDSSGNNPAPNGYGIEITAGDQYEGFWGSAEVNINSNVISSNQTGVSSVNSSFEGGSIYINMDNNRIGVSTDEIVDRGNEYSGIYTEAGGSFTNNIIAYNGHVQIGNAALITSGTSSDITGNQFISNVAGGMALGSTTGITIGNNVFTDNLYSMHLTELEEVESSGEILAFADLLTDRHPDITKIATAPSGGTEAAIVTALMYEIKYPNRAMKVEPLPISTHSALRLNGLEIVDTNHFLKYISENGVGFGDENVLFIDDNSNTGLTLRIATDTLVQSGAKSVICRVVQADPIRIQIKSGQEGQFVPHPSVFDESVGFVPITRGAGIFANDRQMLKLERLNVLTRHYNRGVEKSKDNREQRKIETVSRNRGPDVKVCGVHNIADALACIEAGVTSLGIHLTYEQEEYTEKYRKIDDPRVGIHMQKVRDFHKDRDLPLPWLEIRSIRDMFRKLDNMGVRSNMFLLMRPDNAEEALRLLRATVPADTAQNITLQLQGEYSRQMVAQLRSALDDSCYRNVSIIQMLALDEDELEIIIAEVNADANIQSILIDTKKIGGTGEPGEIERQVEIIKRVKKGVYLAGGLSGSNIHEIMQRMLTEGVVLQGLDLESSVELDEPIVEIQPDGSIIKMRKDRYKIGDFVKEVDFSDYMLFPVKSTKFWKALKEGWKYAQEKLGYYDPKTVAEGFWQYATGEDLITPLGLNGKNTFIQTFVEAATSYSELPARVQGNLDRSEECETSHTDQLPVVWINPGTGNFLSRIAEVRGLNVMIWTAGEEKEQRLRYEVSGLEGLMEQIFPEGGKPDFRAKPDKLAFFASCLKDWVHYERIVVIDNNADNLDSVREISDRYGLENVRVVPVDRPLDDCVEVFVDLGPNDLVLLDMDDVLLDEEFRRFHQPRNIYFSLKKAGYYHE